MRGCTLAIVDSCDVSSCSRSGSSLSILRCNLFELCCTRSKSGWVMCQDTGARTAHSSPTGYQMTPESPGRSQADLWILAVHPRTFPWSLEAAEKGSSMGMSKSHCGWGILGKEAEDFAWRFSGCSIFNVYRENHRTFHFWVRCATIIRIRKMDRWMILCHWCRCQYCKLIYRPPKIENCKLFACHWNRTKGLRRFSTST